MKKIQKLVLRKETISNLSSNDLNTLKGGEGGMSAECTNETVCGCFSEECTAFTCTLGTICCSTNCY